MGSPQGGRRSHHRRRPAPRGSSGIIRVRLYRPAKSCIQRGPAWSCQTPWSSRHCYLRFRRCRVRPGRHQSSKQSWHPSRSRGRWSRRRYHGFARGAGVRQGGRRRRRCRRPRPPLSPGSRRSRGRSPSAGLLDGSSPKSGQPSRAGVEGVVDGVIVRPSKSMHRNDGPA